MLQSADHDSYHFDLPTPTSILGLPIGQHISIGAAIEQPDGSTKEIMRSYTPISGDHQPGRFDLLIKSYPTGNISKHMASLAVGQTIRVRGPKGAFIYTPNMVRHFGMIAGGTGITPMLQVVRAIVRGRATGDRTKVDLIFANVTPQDILLKEDLDALAQQDEGFKIHYVLDKPSEGWTGGVGYVTADMITVSRQKSLFGMKPLIWTVEMAAQTCQRCQSSALRTSTHDQRPEEGHCKSWFCEGSTCEQARRSGLCVLRMQIQRPTIQ
jgi:NAD(P)H-flavin reductase